MLISARVYEVWKFLYREFSRRRLFRDVSFIQAQRIAALLEAGQETIALSRPLGLPGNSFTADKLRKSSKNDSAVRFRVLLA
jgi:hypothetical protein